MTASWTSSSRTCWISSRRQANGACSMDGSSKADGLLRPGRGFLVGRRDRNIWLSPHGPSPLSQPLPGQQIPAHSLAAAPAAAGVPVIIQQQQQQQQAAATTTAAPAAAYAVSAGTTRPADAPGIETMHAPGAFSGFDASRFPTAQQQPAVQPQPHGQQQLPPGYVPLPGQPPHAAAVPNMAYPQPALAYALRSRRTLGTRTAHNRATRSPVPTTTRSILPSRRIISRPPPKRISSSSMPGPYGRAAAAARDDACGAGAAASIRTSGHARPSASRLCHGAVGTAANPGVPAKLLPKVQKSGGAMRSNSQPKDDGFETAGRVHVRAPPAPSRPSLFSFAPRGSEHHTRGMQYEETATAAILF